MARSPPLPSRASPPFGAALLSALLHLGLGFVLLVNGGKRDGDDQPEAPTSHLALIAAPEVDRREGIQLRPLELIVPKLDTLTPPRVEVDEPAPLQQAPAVLPLATLIPLPAVREPVDAKATAFTLAPDEKAILLQQLVGAAERLISERESEVTWEHSDKQYRAQLVLEPAKDGTTMDRVVAEVSAQSHGKPITTLVRLKRLAFSSYSQVVDRWDPTVQMHDDAIDGRVHINSRFNLMGDRQTAPQLLGKVSTAAGGFNLQSTGRRRARDIFRGGIETRAGRISFPEQIQPFAWAPREANARIHECAGDTRIFFFPDGSYTLLDIDSRTSSYRTAASEEPVYFIGNRGVTLYVKGVVSGSVLVYSPERIVIEGNLTYARDPRREPNSRDYLGLVSDGNVVIAPARVTGHEDLDVHAAILARRRFLVTDIEYTRSATLRILGSLSAGTLSATEPRYATKLEYDRRFETHRPPGFPATNRFALDEWSNAWLAGSDE